jgi:hypothetical protein
MNPSKLNNHITAPFTQSSPIDFFAELSKIVKTNSYSTTYHIPATCSSSSSSSSSSSPNTFDENSICLISKEKLHPNHITLSCNHKFNYIPIYKEILYQKNKSNTQYEVTKLDSHQIKCPYCRTITNKLLPFIQYPSVHFSKNIHAYAPDCISAIQCSHIIKHRKKNSHDTRCNKNAVYYEAGNLLLCPTHYSMHSSKSNASVSASKCCAILKTGQNAGKPCNNTITIDGSTFCKRHSHS